MSREHAEAHVQIIAEILEGDLSTRQDMRDLKDEMQKMEYRLTIKLGALVMGLAAAMTGVIKLLVS